MQAIGNAIFLVALVGAVAGGIYCTYKSYRQQHQWLESLAGRYDWIHESSDKTATVQSLETNLAISNIKLTDAKFYCAFGHFIVFADFATKQYKDRTRIYLCLQRDKIPDLTEARANQQLTIAYTKSPFAATTLGRPIYKDRIGWANVWCCTVSQKNTNREQIAEMLGQHRELIEQYCHEEWVDYVTVSPEWLCVGHYITATNYDKVVCAIKDKLVTHCDEQNCV